MSNEDHVWEYALASADALIEAHLVKGWEPFAVTLRDFTHIVHFRRVKGSRETHPNE